MTRQPELERRWLRRVADQAGYMDAQDFFDAVGARLEKGAVEYSDNFMDKNFGELVAEAREETVDCPAWLVLAIQRFQSERDHFPPEVAEHIERILIEAAGKAVEAWYVVGMALEFYAAHGPEPVGVNAPPYSHFAEE